MRGLSLFAGGSGAFMKDRKLATRYARALLGALATPAEQNLADEFLTALANSMTTNAELRGFFLDPGTPAGAKKSLLANLCTPRNIPERVKTFLEMIVDNSRLANLPSIAEVFHLERESAQGMVSATLTAAAPLTPELKVRTAEALEKLSGRKVSLTIEIDPGLLGGAVAQVGSMVYDGSLKTQLARLRRTMGEE
jgi:F-type H+-transporting ATPase subunit delta